MNASLGIDLAPYLSGDRVIRVEHPIGKAALLARLIERTASHPLVGDAAGFTKAIYEREEVTSTGIGGGIAVPHARLPSVKGFVMSLALLPHGIDFAAQDGAPVRVVVMMAACDDDHPRYLRTLATVAMRLKQPGLVTELSRTVEPHRAIDVFLGRSASS